jgi:transcriptional regulator with XRE-family HTH domain
VPREISLKIQTMGTKPQHNMMYRLLPSFLKEMREKAGLTQRELGKLINKPHSYIYNCEVANRRVDITEFIVWSKACGVDPKKAFDRLLKNLEE